MADRVSVVPGAYLVGGSLILSGSLERLSNFKHALLSLNIQSSPSNANDVYLYDSGAHVIIHVLTPGSSYSVDIDSVTKIMLNGTTDEVVYWSGLSAK